MRTGHRVRLYCYDNLGGIPDGIDVADAEQIVSRKRIVRYADGSVSLFSNLFRYELQRRGEGLWADTDHYFLKAHDFSVSYVFGRQQNGDIGTGVMRLPSDCPFLPSLIGLFDSSEVAPWASRGERVIAIELLAERGRVPPDRMRWAYTGPRAFSHFVAKFGLEGKAQPQDAFYPADFSIADWILDPLRSLDEFLTPKTIGLHLWNQKIKHFKNEQAPRGSFLERLHDEGA